MEGFLWGMATIIVGFFLSGILRAFEFEWPPVRRIGWRRIRVAARNVASALRDLEARDGGTFRPDAIVALEPGGIIVTGLLVTNWAVDLVRDVPIHVLRQRLNRRGSVWVSAFATPAQTVDSASVRGKKVLVIDSVVWSGQTLTAAVQKLDDLGADEVKTAVLWRQEGAQLIPDACAGEMRLRRAFPWAMTNEYRRTYWKWSRAAR